MKPEVEYKVISEFAEVCIKAVALYAVASYILAATLRFAQCNQGLWVLFPVLFGGLGSLIVFVLASRMVWLQNHIADANDTETQLTKAENFTASAMLVLTGIGVTIVLVAQFALSNVSSECLVEPIVPSLSCSGECTK